MTTPDRCQKNGCRRKAAVEVPYRIYFRLEQRHVTEWQEWCVQCADDYQKEVLDGNAILAWAQNRLAGFPDS